MKFPLQKIVLLFCFLIIGKAVYAQVKTVDAINVTRVDTFALKGMPDQPVIKINIKVIGSTGTLSLQNLIVHTLNQDNTDVDSLTVYYTNAKNRFSLIDYPGEAFRLSSRKKPAGDSIILDNLSHVLETGDNYFWVTMSLSQYSRASHTLDAYIKKNQITVSGTTYPTENISPDDNILIYDIYFRDNFEVPKLNGEPTGWTQEQVNSSPVRWKNYYGGYGLGVTGHPDAPISGKWNVMLQRQETTPRTTILVSKALDLSLSSRPLLTFYHGQETWDKGGGVLQNDELRVLFKIGDNGTWQELRKYELPTPLLTWVKREILIPEGASVNNVILGFEGTTKYGYGVCLDSITIYETGIVSREVKNIVVSQPVTEVVPQGNNQNPVMRLNIRIKGNTGSILLNSLKVRSLNTSDNDLKPSGVKLFFTNDSVFQSPVQWGTAQTFSGGIAEFAGLDKTMETGDNFLWITYDIAANSTPGNTLDLKIMPGDIVLSTGGTLPSSEQSPAGARLIKQTLFFDDFEGAMNWTLTGEFQVGSPQGLGGGAGYPDPPMAYSGAKVLGTDLDGNGNYELNVPAAGSYTAQSPLIDGKYFKNLQLDFYRFLNIDNTDSAYIEYKLNGTTDWRKLWNNTRRYVDTKWSKHPSLDLGFLERKKFNLRFRLGPTDAIDNYSGWNIDYLMVTADSIPYDAAVVNIKYPNSSCDLSSNEYVKAYIKNTGPKPLVNTPVQLSIDGGKTFINETIPNTINPDDSIEYTFTQASNFSKKAVYRVIVKTAHSGDNYPKNDTMSRTIVSFPTYSLPYKTGFENDTNFWVASGVNSSWFEGDPSGTKINLAAEGEKCWKTDNGGYHNLKEYSYVESPCFSFSGKEIPMIDIKFNTYTKDTLNGAVLEYSLDQGATWIYAPEDTYPYSWNWYNKNVISLSALGWTKRTLNESNEQIWKDGRQILPGALANQAKVKFRFVFKTDDASASRDEGFAFDDLKIYNAPFDIGATEFVGLDNPSCQYQNNPKLKVAVKNFGYRTMHSGDTVIVGVKVNNLPHIADTFLLTKDFAKDDTMHFRMKKPVNISTAATYTMRAFTLIEKDNNFFGPVSNDSVELDIEVYPNPVLNMIDTIRTAHPDTVILKPNIEADCSYVWHDGSSDNTFAVSDIGVHWVLAINSLTGCSTQDSTYIKLLVPDAGVAEIVTPVTNCGYGTAHHPVIKIKNMGTDTLRRNDSIFVYMGLDGGTYKKDTILLSKDLAPDSLYQTSLGFTFDLSAAETHDLISFTKMKYDTVARNDTLKTTFTIHGYPHIFLGNDTTIKGKLSYELNAGTGHKTILWSDGITTSEKYTISWPGKYYVTVTDNHDCASTDTIKVHLVIHDLAMRQLSNPVNACSQSANTSVRCIIKNTGTDTIKTTEPILLYYQVNNGTKQEETLNITNELLPNDSLLFTFAQKLDMTVSGSYAFKLKSILTNDIQPLNDSILQTVQVYGNPQIDLGEDRIVQALTYTLYPGKFASYEWQDNSVDTAWTITKTKYQTNNTYWVTVTDQYGCTDRDTVAIFLLINDLSVTDMILPNTSCSMSPSESINVKITNTGNAPLNNRLVDISYSLNGGTEVKESFTFNGAVGTSMLHTFKTPLNMSAKGIYSFLAKVKMPADVNPVNDTATFKTTVLGYPNVDFKAPNDTFTVKFPFTLHAGPGYPEYLWQDNSTDSVFTITQANYQPADPTYSVIVTDANGCSVSKSVKVIEALQDLAINGITTPLANCTLPAGKLGVVVKNNSTVALSNQAISLAYSLNGGTQVTKSATVNLSKNATQTIEFDENVNMSATATHTLNVTLTFAGDEKVENNTAAYEVKVFGNPNYQFSQDTVKVSGYPYNLDAGADYPSYLWNNNTTQRVLNVGADGWYSMKVTDTNGCSARDSVYIKLSTGTNWLKEDARISVYPNPALNYLFIDIELDKKQSLVMDIVSQEGKAVYQKKLENILEYRDEVDVSGFPEGLYYVRLYTKDAVVVKKIIVK